MKNDPFDNLTPEEDFAVYESGLCARGCLEHLDEYMRESIIRYGRILLRNKKEELEPKDNNNKSIISITRNFGHPWTREDGFDLLEIKEDTEEKLTQQIARLEKEFWKVWVRDNTGKIIAVMYKPTNITLEWKDL